MVVNRICFYYLEDSNIILGKYMTDKNTLYKEFDNIYSLIDFISYNNLSNVLIEFMYFKNNQMDMIINNIVKYKSISYIEAYNAFVITNKKIKRKIV